MLPLLPRRPERAGKTQPHIEILLRGMEAHQGQTRW
jgi:hypothetical protein